MPIVRTKLTRKTRGRVNREKLDATTEKDIQRFIAEYEKEAEADARVYAKPKRARIAAARRMKRDSKGRFISLRKTALSKKRLTA